MPLFKSSRSATIVLLVAPSIFVFQCLPVVLAQNSTSSVAQKMIKPITYPPARKGDQVDDYHGVKVADPYRWLEELDSDETKRWVEAENKLTFGYLSEIPARPTITDRLT
jgi:prolyl oligopeptidase